MKKIPVTVIPSDYEVTEWTCFKNRLHDIHGIKIPLLSVTYSYQFIATTWEEL